MFLKNSKAVMKFNIGTSMDNEGFEEPNFAKDELYFYKDPLTDKLQPVKRLKNI